MVDRFQDVIFMRNPTGVIQNFVAKEVNKQATFVAPIHDTMTRYWLAFGEGGVAGHDFGILLKKLHDDYGSQTVIDVGSNCGRFTYQAASFGFSVYTFEPLRMNFLRLSMSRCVNNWQERVNLINRGASDEASVMTIVENESNGQGILPEDPSKTLGGAPVNPADILTIETVRLDDVIDIDDHRVIPIFKVDCEGYEGKALIGASRILASGKVRTVALEVSPRNLLALSKMTVGELFRLLDGYGFNIYLVDVTDPDLGTALAAQELRPSSAGGYNEVSQRFAAGGDLTEWLISPARFDLLGKIFDDHVLSQANIIAFSRKH